MWNSAQKQFLHLASHAVLAREMILHPLNSSACFLLTSEVAHWDLSGLSSPVRKWYCFRLHTQAVQFYYFFCLFFFASCNGTFILELHGLLKAVITCWSFWRLKWQQSYGLLHFWGKKKKKMRKRKTIISWFFSMNSYMFLLYSSQIYLFSDSSLLIVTK